MLCNYKSAHGTDNRQDKHRVSIDTMEQHKLSALKWRDELQTSEEAGRQDRGEVDEHTEAIEAATEPVAFAWYALLEVAAQRGVDVFLHLGHGEEHHPAAEEEEERKRALGEAEGSILASARYQGLGASGRLLCRSHGCAFDVTNSELLFRKRGSSLCVSVGELIGSLLASACAELVHYIAVQYKRILREGLLIFAKDLPSSLPHRVVYVHTDFSHPSPL